MMQLIALIASFRRDEEGQGLAEYALILALIAIIAIIALIFLGPGQLDPEHRRQLGLRPSSTTAWTAGRETGGLGVCWCLCAQHVQPNDGLLTIGGTCGHGGEAPSRKGGELE